MGLIGGLLLIALGVFIGFAYFHLRKKPSDSLVDQDYLDCEKVTSSKSDLAVCYIDKKSAKIKKELNLAD